MLIVTSTQADDPSSFPIPFERGSKKAPAVSVCYDPDYPAPGSKRSHGVIACVWSDGRTVWSGNRTNGGPPYFTGRIERKRLREFMAALDVKGIFDRKVWFSVGFDSPHHDINIINGKRRLAMSSTLDYLRAGKTPDRITIPMPYPSFAGRLSDLFRERVNAPHLRLRTTQAPMTRPMPGARKSIQENGTSVSIKQYEPQSRYHRCVCDRRCSHPVCPLRLSRRECHGAEERVDGHVSHASLQHSRRISNQRFPSASQMIS
jgi:hypothetical protein